jgi:2-aminoadipate transaminase
VLCLAKSPIPGHTLKKGAMGRPAFVRFSVTSFAGRRVGAADIVATLADDIRSGRLPAGSRLPPVRVVEQQLGLSKNTVKAAYDELAARCLVEARQREGSFVARAPRQAGVTTVASPPLPELRDLPPLGLHDPRSTALNLSSVFVDPTLLPRKRIADCIRSVLRQPGLAALYDQQGYGPLRELIAARLRRRGMHDITAANVVITTGSQQALDVIGRVLAERRVALESPVYWGAKYLFASHGLELIGLPIRPFERLPLDLWERKLRSSKPGLLYAITSYQNPTGYSYSSDELLRLLQLSRELGFAIAEDDWGSDMLSGSEYRPSLRLLGGASVLHIDSFTKKLLPSLRVGFLTAHERIVPTLVTAKRLATLGNAWLCEAALAEFLDRGYYDSHLATMQRELDRRYAGCLKILRETMPEEVRFTTPGGGPTLWVEVPPRVDLGALRANCLRRGVAIEHAANAFDGPPHLHGFRVSYAFLPPDSLARAVQVVAEAVAAQLARYVRLSHKPYDTMSTTGDGVSLEEPRRGSCAHGRFRNLK